MGMFDWVDVGQELPCIKCKTPIPESGWQSKDSYCQLDKLTSSHVNCFYTMCDNCGTWNEYRRKRNKPAFSHWFTSSFNQDEWEIVVRSNIIAPDVSAQSELPITESSPTIPESILTVWEDYYTGISVSREHITSTLIHYLPQIVQAVRQTRKLPDAET